MNIKLNILTAAILAGFAGSALAGKLAEPSGPPAPLAKLNASIATNPAEQSAFALYEGVLQQAEAAIVAKSCSAMAGEYSVSAFADGFIPSQADDNWVKVISPGSTFQLNAYPQTTVPFRGQEIKVVGGGAFKGVALRNYSGNFFFNVPSTIMTGDATTVAGGNFIAGKVIKDFYIDGKDERTELYRVTDYGLQAVLKAGSLRGVQNTKHYPLHKYWQRSRTLRSNGVEGHTVFVKDRLVGPSPCRIVLYTHGENQENFFQQTGKLKIYSPHLNSPINVAWPE